jgi:lipopolysaccharide transport system ATP-binding protein
MSDVAIRAEGLSKRYQTGQREPYKALRDVITEAMTVPIRRLSALAQSTRQPKRARGSSREWIWALKDVSFEINHGDVVGIVGRNGAGKSTLLKILSRITKPSSGSADLYGRVGSLLEVGTGFHPELTGRENIYLNGAVLGMKKAEIERKFDDIIAFAEIEQFIDTPVKRYSSGMYVRLAFAVAAHLEPEILIVDEVLAVGDAQFQKKCLGKMGDVAKEGRTVLFVSHNMNAIQRLCSQSMLLAGGQLVAYADTPTIVSMYLASGVQESTPARWIDTSAVSRQGSGQVYVESVWYSSGNTTIGMRPYPLGPLEIRLTLVSDAPRPVGSVAVIIFDKNGTKLINADTVSLGQIVHLRKGHNVVHFRIEELYLSPGAYVLGWWLGDALGSIYEFVGSAFDIEVLDLVTNGLGARPRYDGAVPCSFQILEVN